MVGNGKMAESELMTAQRYKTLIERNPHGIQEIDLQGTIVYANQAHHNIYGYERGELIGRSVEEFLVPGPQRDGLLEYLETLAKDQPPPTIYQQTVLRPDGQERDIEVSWNYLRDEEENVGGFISVLTDITDRRRAEDTARAEQMRFAEAMNAIDAFVYVADIETHELLFVNAYGKETWGDRIGEPCWAVLQSGQNGPCHFCTNDKILDADGSPGEPYIWEFQNTVNGRWYECRDKAIRWLDGRMVRIEIATDVTDRKQVAEALRYAAELNETIISNSPVGITIADETGQCVMTNDATARMVGATREQVLEQNYNDLESWRASGMLEAARSAIEEGEAKHHSLRVTTTFGQDLSIDCHFIPFMRNGAPYIMVTMTDTTDGEKAEKSLRESEASLKALVEGVQTAIVVHDGDGKILRSNEMARRLLERLSPDIDGMDLSDPTWHFCDENGTRVPVEEYPVSRIMATRQAVDGLLLGLCDPGGSQTLWVLVNGTPVIEKDGHLSQVIVSFIDITDRKRAEEALLASEERFRLLSEASPMGAFRTDEKGSVLYTNPRWQEITGLTLEESLGIGWAGAIHQGDSDGVLQEWSKCLREGKSYSGEFRFLTPSGDVRWVKTVTAPVRDSDAGVIGHVGANEDITERKQAEEALRRSEERFRRIIENSEPIIFMVDPDGRFVLSEGHSLAALGLRPGEVVGLSAFEIYAEYPEVVAGLENALDGETCRDTVELDGLFFDTFYSPCLDGEGKVTAAIGMGINVTDSVLAEEQRRSLEAQVQHSQKLESLGVLAGGIAHDFNNLLMTILGHADLALQDLSPVSPVRPSIQEIEGAARRAADLARQMLAYSGKGHFVVAPLSLSEVVGEMAHLLESSISKKAKLTTRLESDIPDIEADAAQVQQVIMNLITNASDAIGQDEPGAITVSTGVRECSREFLAASYLDEKQPEGSYVYIEVADTGCGMHEETRSKVFDPFFSTKFTGRGLGLAATLGIVRGHNGAIMVDTQVGKGTTFRVLFPALAEEARTREPTGDLTRQDDWKGTGTVLVVDDEDSVRRLVVTMIERLGFDVLEAADGREGVEIFEKNAETITCVLLDLTMPRMDGGEACLAIQNITDDVPVILSSGYEESELSQRFDGYGMAGFIQKPYRLTKLRAILQSVLKPEQKP